MSRARRHLRDAFRGPHDKGQKFRRRQITLVETENLETGEMRLQVQAQGPVDFEDFERMTMRALDRMTKEQSARSQGPSLANLLSPEFAPAIQAAQAAGVNLGVATK